MSRKHKGDGEDGQNGPDEVVSVEGDPMIEIARHLTARAVDLQGNPSPSTSVLLALRNEPERARLLDALVLALAPDQAHLGQWVDWLNGGASPFPKKDKVEKVGKDTEWPSQTLIRTSPRVNRQRKKVNNLKAQLELEESRLRFAEAHDKAAMQWFVSDHLAAYIGPVFAMGPAWTIMRSVSAHLSDESADNVTFFMGGNAREEAIAKLRLSRKAETQMMLKILDLGSGVAEFEDALRAAILKVCQDFDGQQEKLLADGRRARAKSLMETTIHPKAETDSAEVLEGLKKAS